MSGDRLDAAARACARDEARKLRARERQTLRENSVEICGLAGDDNAAEYVGSNYIVEQLAGLTMAVCNLAETLDARR